MKHYDTYLEAEQDLCNEIINNPDFMTKTTFEKIGTGFVLDKPWNNMNGHSNYEYAREFYEWMMSGEKQLSEKLIQLNPWVQRFIDTTGLPDSFSSSYGWKLQEQMVNVLDEIDSNQDSRRAYFNILTPADQIILRNKTTHEFPCTIGIQIMIREEKLSMIVNMRSNNIYAVMPYDVYNFTNLLFHLSEELEIPVGKYYHQINNAHIYKGDVRRLKTI